jgi:hypothetical protein
MSIVCIAEGGVIFISVGVHSDEQKSSMLQVLAISGKQLSILHLCRRRERNNRSLKMVINISSLNSAWKNQTDSNLEIFPKKRYLGQCLLQRIPVQHM